VTVQSAEGALLAAFEQPRRALCLAFIMEQARACISVEVRDLACGAGACRTGHALPACRRAVRYFCLGARAQLVRVSAPAAQGCMQALVPHHSHKPFPHKALSEPSAGGARQVLVSGGEDGSLTAWDLRANAAAFSRPRAHAARIRGVAALGAPAAAGSGGSDWLVGAASSDGVVRLWDLRRAGGGGAPASGAGWLAEAATGARLTCLCAAAAPPPPLASAPAGAAAAGAAPAPAPAARSKKRRRQPSDAPEGVGARAAAAAGPPDSGRPSRGGLAVRSRQAAAPGKRKVLVPPQPGASVRAGRGGGRAAGRGRGAEPRAAAEDGVRVRDGVVEFLDPPRPAAGGKLKKKKKKAAALRATAAASAGR